MITDADMPVVVSQCSHLHVCCVPKDQIDAATWRELQRVGRVVASVRAWRNLRQEGLAELAGVTARHIQRIEAGAEDVATSYYVRLATGLKVPLYWLFTEDWPQFIDAYERAEGTDRDGSGSPGAP